MERQQIVEQAGYTWKYWKNDLPASIVVFLVALPLCMGVALASGAPVTTGLVTGIVGGIIVGFLAGSPLQVSGPAAGLTVIVYSLIQTLGIEKLGVCVLAAGILQLAAGSLRMGQWFRAVSPAVIQGMLAGIGLLILSSQFHVMLGDKPRHSGWENFITIPQALMKSFPLPELGNAEQRAAETQELKTLGLLHLQQNEIAEEVHHLLTDIAQEPVVDSQDRPQPPPGVVPRDLAPSLSTTAQRRLAAGLHELVARQTAILTALDEFKTPKSSSEFAVARLAISSALLELEQGDIFAARVTQDTAEQSLRELLDARKNHGFAALLGLLTIVTLVSWKALSFRGVKYIPPSLIAVVIATMVAYIVRLPVLYVEVPTNLTEEIYFPTFAELRSLLTPTPWLFIFQLAIIGSAESLLCAAAVDRQHAGPRTNYDRELQSQGIGNMICGLLCALPLTGVIVRSSVNIQTGAKTRWAAILHGVWLLLFVCVFTALLRMIPTAALAAVLVYAGYKLIDFQAIRALAKRDGGEVAIYIATALAIVATDLLVGVLIGLALSIAKLIYVFAYLEVDLEEPSGDDAPWVLHLHGSATFLRLPLLAAALERVPLNAKLLVDVEHLDYIDSACRDLLEYWEEQNKPLGAELILDAESLQARFWRRRNGAPHSHVPPLLGAAHAHGKQRPI